MEPMKVEKLPINYNIDKELLRLIAEANERYGEYKSNLKNSEFDSKFFLNSIILSESLKSTQIEGTQISQDEMYYLKYMPKTDDNLEIQNLKKVIEYAKEHIKKIDIKFVNKIHKILLDSVRGNEKEPGKIRTIQNWIGPTGCTINEAIYVPPAPEEVPMLLDNLFQYMNDAYIDPIFINIAISHSQFETIHAYRDGNGRLGRALIPIQLAMLTEDEPILFLSEIIELYKPSYYKYLNESRKGNMLGFIKFFLQCIIDQCNNYIAKINRIKQIYNTDMKKISKINGTTIYRIMPVIMKQIVFTKKEVEEESGVSRNTVSRVIDQLVSIGILVQDSTYAKLSYRYKDIYDVFVGKNMQ
ncbi:MAG TPA: Fic family protein [Candidatus Onthousia faecigallinarum]|nr:Fic family protein [Candidatus Onthousia faecigallinarum]